MYKTRVGHAKHEDENLMKNIQAREKTETREMREMSIDTRDEDT